MERADVMVYHRKIEDLLDEKVSPGNRGAIYTTLAVRIAKMLKMPKQELLEQISKAYDSYEVWRP
jgi:hypothetical protein